MTPALDPAELKTACALLGQATLLLWESLAPYMSFFEKRTGVRLLHGARNLALGLLNAACTAAVLTALWARATARASHGNIGVLNWLGLQGAWRWAAMLLLFDAWMYWWDLLFRSRRTRNDTGSIAFGLDGFDRTSQQSLRGLLSMPWTRP